MIGRWYVRLPNAETASELFALLKKDGFCKERAERYPNHCYLVLTRRYDAQGPFDPDAARRRISKLADERGGCLDGFAPDIELD